MKTTLLFIILFSSCTCINTSKAQQLLNGGFEDTYFLQGSSDSLLTPSGWGFGWITDDCWAFLGNLTDDSHSGDWAIKLETVGCAWGTYAGVAFPKPENPSLTSFPENNAHEINSRPDQISFYHKFTPVNNDTALVQVLLFNFPDSATNIYPEVLSYIDTVAFVEFQFTEFTDTYSQVILNIEYQNADIPAYIRVVFYSDKKAAISPPIQYGNPGTTLWIDDVELIYLPTSQENLFTSDEVKLSPNPVQEFFRIDLPGNTTINSLSVYDNSGRVVKNPVLESGIYSLSGLVAGMYFVQIETDKGCIVKKVIKE
jgi:hypothetical protein